MFVVETSGERNVTGQRGLCCTAQSLGGVPEGAGLITAPSTRRAQLFQFPTREFILFESPAFALAITECLNTQGRFAKIQAFRLRLSGFLGPSEKGGTFLLARAQQQEWPPLSSGSLSAPHVFINLPAVAVSLIRGWQAGAVTSPCNQTVASSFLTLTEICFRNPGM